MSTPHGLLLDLTRTVNRARHQTLSGIDRVERAYLDWLLASQTGTRLCLIRMADGWRLVGREGALALGGFLDGGHEPPALDMRARLSLVKPPRARAAETLVRRHTLAQARGIAQLAPVLRTRLPDGGVYLNVGHDDLAPETMAAIRAAGLSPVVMVHDVIPMDWPEYARPGGAAKFRPRLAAAAMSDLIVTNSRDTAGALAERMALEGLRPPTIHPVPLGIGDDLLRPALPLAEPEGRPAFVQIGTIEPRKNHLLTLQIWRRMWDTMRPEETPLLHIAGRRGWENEQVLDLLERAPMMGVTVFEHAGLDDHRLAGLLRGARALLLPSFVEGFGLPLGEALLAGVPVIAADLPAHREVGGAAPDYLDPLDGAGWMAAIADYAAPASPRRAAQIARMAGWHPPRWSEHFAALGDLLPGGVGPGGLASGGEPA